MKVLSNTPKQDILLNNIDKNKNLNHSTKRTTVNGFHLLSWQSSSIRSSFLDYLYPQSVSTGCGLKDKEEQKKI